MFKSIVKRTLPRFIKGSMTVEAAVVLPLFLFFFISLSSSVEMIRLHGNMSLALMETGNKISYYGAFLKSPVKEMGMTGHIRGSEEEEKSNEKEGQESDPGRSLLEEIGDLTVSYAYVRNRIIEYLGSDYLDHSPIDGGSKGLSFFESEIFTDDDCVDIGVTYRVSPMIKFGDLFSFRMANRYYAHLWNGYDVNPEKKTENEDETVYITKDSEVYHTSVACTYLRLSVRPASYSGLDFERNSSGGRYTRCLICARGEPPFIVYLCDEGDKYHYSKNCYTLKRSYEEVKLRDVAYTHRPCSRCGGKHGD